jgi:predicted dehydrogenase
MRAGIVGTGFIGAVHALALGSLGVEVAWAAGRNDDLHALLDDDRVDVLHVCTPNHLHSAQALAALERGVHVVCEKPLAVTSEECQTLVVAAAERGLVNAVCYHARGYPLVEHMRAEVAAGAVGELTFVHGRYLCDDVLFPASGWRTDPARSGSSYVVGDLGTHWLDLAEHVMGRHVSEVLADFRSFAGGPLEDYAALLLRFDGGAAGSLVLSAGAAARKNQLLFELEGRAGGFTWDQEMPTEALFRPVDGPRQVVVKDPLTNAETARSLSRYPAGHGEGYGGAFHNLFGWVYDAVHGRPHAPFPTFRDGARGVATVEAAVRSRGAWVRL